MTTVDVAALWSMLSDIWTQGKTRPAGAGDKVGGSLPDDGAAAAGREVATN